LVAHSYLADEHPADIALPCIEETSHGGYRSVGLEPHSVIVSCGDFGYGGPVTDIALSAVIPSRGDQRAVRFKTHSVFPASGDKGNIRPTTDIALPPFVVSSGNYSVIRLESHRAKLACG